MAAEGGCFCGKVRYSISGEPVTQARCHCLDCRKISGSAFSTNTIYKSDGFKLLSGTPKTIAKTADSGQKITNFFCGDCGSTMWRETASYPGCIILKVGTLDSLDALNSAKPAKELFSQHRVDWVPQVAQ